MMKESSENWVDWHDCMAKDEADDFEFGSPAVVSKFAFLLAKQAAIMDTIPVSLGSDRLDVAKPLLMGISSNALAIVNLARNNFGNEVYPITRCLIERLITFYYLQFCDKSEISDYIDYSKQKTYRKLDSSIAVNDKIFQIKCTAEVDLDDHPELRSAVAKFTSRKSKRPITRWSGTSLEQRLETYLLPTSCISQEHVKH